MQLACIHRIICNAFKKIKCVSKYSLEQGRRSQRCKAALQSSLWQESWVMRQLAFQRAARPCARKPSAPCKQYSKWHNLICSRRFTYLYDGMCSRRIDCRCRATWLLSVFKLAEALDTKPSATEDVIGKSSGRNTMRISSTTCSIKALTHCWEFCTQKEETEDILAQALHLLVVSQILQVSKANSVKSIMGRGVYLFALAVNLHSQFKFKDLKQMLKF